MVGSRSMASNCADCFRFCATKSFGSNNAMISYRGKTRPHCAVIFFLSSKTSLRLLTLNVSLWLNTSQRSNMLLAKSRKH